MIIFIFSTLSFNWVGCVVHSCQFDGKVSRQHRIVLVEGNYLFCFDEPIWDGLRFGISYMAMSITNCLLLLLQTPPPPHTHTQLSLFPHVRTKRPIFDVKWFIDCPDKGVQRARLVARHLETWSEAKSKMFGAGEEGAGRKADSNDMINAVYIDSTAKKYADLIIQSL